HLLQRRFSSSRITLLQRIYSYPLTATFTAIVLLLTMPDTQVYDADAAVIACLGVLYCVALAIALTPNRQTLQDWTRFRHTQMSKSQQSPLWKELLISDNSSPAIAISLNVFLAAGLFTGWFLLCHPDVLNTRLAILNLGGVVLLFIGSVICSVLTSQILLLLRHRKNWFWFCVTVSVSGLSFPGLTLLIRNILLESDPHKELLLGILPFSVFAIPLSLLATVTATLAFVHIRQLSLVGRSEFQQLLSNTQPQPPRVS
ncbi:MAG: hypothetical protein AAFN08_09810, partial [Cyanobacteria bacterium J06559_3]